MQDFSLVIYKAIIRIQCSLGAETISAMEEVLCLNTYYLKNRKQFDITFNSVAWRHRYDHGVSVVHCTARLTTIYIHPTFIMALAEPELTGHSQQRKKR